MKPLFSLLFLSLFLAACGGSEGTEVTSGEAVDENTSTVKSEASTQYLVDPSASMVIWEGTKVVGGGHTGEIPVENGQLIVKNEDNSLVAGQFVLDLRKMTNTDLPADKAKDLLGHLSAPEFFDVAKYPMVNFNLVSIEPVQADDHTHLLLGNLTMKGKERSVKIPATVTVDGDKLMANTPKFTIDRNDWGVSYGNSILESAKDKIISDELGLEIKLVANRD